MQLVHIAATRKDSISIDKMYAACAVENGEKKRKIIASDKRTSCLLFSLHCDVTHELLKYQFTLLLSRMQLLICAATKMNELFRYASNRIQNKYFVNRESYLKIENSILSSKILHIMTKLLKKLKKKQTNCLLIFLHLIPDQLEWTASWVWRC